MGSRQRDSSPSWPRVCSFLSVRILVSNDDGIYSPGITALADVASEFGAVCLVAPDVERSSTGHAITASKPLSYRRTKIKNFQAYRVNGTPADCVALGTHHWQEVNFVLSGLNLGLNLGNSIWHSGTLAAAKQAALLGLRGIALSGPAGADPDFEPLKPWVRRVLQVLFHEVAFPLVNVNFPREPRGLIWARASVRRYAGRIIPTNDPSGRELYWFNVTPIEEAEPGTDRWAVEQGWISLTPLRLDLTDEDQLSWARSQHPLDETVAVATSSVPSSPAAAQEVREDEADTALEKTVLTEENHTDTAPRPSSAQ
jgi:5'-nucleotidase